MRVIFCPKCGKHIGEYKEAEFCPYCGFRMGPAKNPVFKKNDSYQKLYTPIKAGSRLTKGSSGKPFFIRVSLIVIVILLLAVFFYGHQEVPKERVIGEWVDEPVYATYLVGTVGSSRIEFDDKVVDAWISHDGVLADDVTVKYENGRTYTYTWVRGGFDLKPVRRQVGTKRVYRERTITVYEPRWW